jgi:hypothetical protein
MLHLGSTNRHRVRGASARRQERQIPKESDGGKEQDLLVLAYGSFAWFLYLTAVAGVAGHGFDRDFPYA